MKKQFNIKPQTSIDFILNINKSYPKCEIKDYIRLKNYLPPHTYKGIQSNEQISTIVNLSYKYKYKYYIDSLIILLSRHISPIKGLYKLITSGKSDTEIYNILRERIKKRSKRSIDKYNYQKITNMHCDSYVRMAQSVNNIVRNNILNKNKKFKINKYLDIGCGDCIKSKLIGNLLNLKDKQIYGADIPEWSSYTEKERKKLPINIIDLKPNEKLPIKNNTYDLVSAFMVLHHIQNLPLMLKELHRIIKPGGYLIIKEHDALTSIDYMLDDIEHAIYQVLYTNNENFYDEHYGEYYDWLEWNVILNKFGFKYIYAKHMISLTSQYHISPTRPYIGVYQKLKK
jgi:ubiquinone/menaquinone biosynthesis C-methylase UbiE